jgi:FkbM family methyltransferase
MIIKKYLKDNRIEIYDIGCAGGIDPIFSKLLNDDLALGYGFDGSKNEINKLKNKSKTKNTQYFNNLISDQNKLIDFYISGTVSSINKRHDREKLYNEKYRYEKIQSYCLDYWLKQKKTNNCGILKLDIEGSEILALKGAAISLVKSICFVKVEFNYHSKINTNNFAEIHKYLTDKKFQLMGITNEENEFFGINSGDGLYFKTIEGFETETNLKLKLNILIQSIYVSITLRKFEYSFLLLNEYKSILPKDIYNEFFNTISRNFYLPNVFSISLPRLSFLFFYLSIFFAGNKSHTKSFPKMNRLVKSKYLYVNLFFNFFKNQYKKKLIKKFHSYKIKKKFND